MSKQYDDDSIDLQKGAHRIRKRPATMLGSAGIDGARHGFTELYGNALDEISTGHGDRLDIVYYEDDSISIRDYGRGVPLGWNAKHKAYNWHVIYNELYGGGKYADAQAELSKITDWDNFDDKQFNYLYSVGLNGLGAASTQYTSEFFNVVSIRKNPETGKNIKTEMQFQHGMPIIEGEAVDVFTTNYDFSTYQQVTEETEEPTGTFIHWKPDSNVFTQVEIGGDWIFEKCKDIVGVVDITLAFENKQTGFQKELHPTGLTGILENTYKGAILKDESGNKKVFEVNAFEHGVTRIEGGDNIWVCKADIVMAFTKSEKDSICYHNSIRTLFGMQYNAIEDAVSEFYRGKARDRKIKLEARDYRGVLGVVASTRSNYTSTRNQTKDAVEDDFVYDIIKNAVLQKLVIEFGKGTAEVVDSVERVIREAEIRIATKEQARLLRDATKVKREKAPEKFSSCDAYEQKRYKEVELWITEGDSANGAVKAARSKVFQATYPVRGKGLNIAKKGIVKALQNKEIREIFSLLGTGFDIEIDGEKMFRMEDLRCHKIIIATDADEDGYQIRVLLFLIFYYLAPRIITEGHLYIAETPRFGINLKGGKVVYALNDVERDRIIEEQGSNIVNISRYKGLGEVERSVLRETTVHPDTRTLIPVTCDLNNETERELIDALFGADKYGQRKNILTTVLGCNVADMLNDNALLIQEINDTDIEEETEYQEV